MDTAKIVAAVEANQGKPQAEQADYSHLATKLGITPNMVSKAGLVLRSGDSTLKDAVRAGTITISTAYAKVLRAHKVRSVGNEPAIQRKVLAAQGASQHTTVKVEALGAFYKALVPTYGPRPFVYVDTNAGPGEYTAAEGADGALGSPVQFMRALTADSHVSIMLMEKDPSITSRLYESIGQHVSKIPWAVTTISRPALLGVKMLYRLLQEVKPWRKVPGLVFLDPMGAGREEWLMAQDLMCFTTWDVLVHYFWNGTQRAAAQNPETCRELEAHIRPMRRDINQLAVSSDTARFGYYFGTDNRERAMLFRSIMGGLPMEEALHLNGG